MANKYANLIGTNLIKDEYTKINTGFDAVETDINTVKTDIANHETAADPHDQYALDTDLATLQTEVEAHEAENLSLSQFPLIIPEVDDTGRFERAFAAVMERRGKLTIPVAHYKVSRDLALNFADAGTSGVTIEGERGVAFHSVTNVGVKSSIGATIEFTKDSGTLLSISGLVGSTVKGIKLANLTLVGKADVIVDETQAYGKSIQNTALGLDIARVTNSYIENVHITGFDIGFRSNHFYSNAVNRMSCVQNNIGCIFDSATNATPFIGCQFHQNYKTNIVIQTTIDANPSSKLSFIGCTLEGESRAILLNPQNANIGVITFINPYFEQNEIVLESGYDLEGNESSSFVSGIYFDMVTASGASAPYFILNNTRNMRIDILNIDSAANAFKVTDTVSNISIGSGLASPLLLSQEKSKQNLLMRKNPFNLIADGEFKSNKTALSTALPTAITNIDVINNVLELTCAPDSALAYVEWHIFNAEQLENTILCLESRFKLDEGFTNAFIRLYDAAGAQIPYGTLNFLLSNNPNDFTSASVAVRNIPLTNHIKVRLYLQNGNATVAKAYIDKVFLTQKQSGDIIMSPYDVLSSLTSRVTCSPTATVSVPFLSSSAYEVFLTPYATGLNPRITRKTAVDFTITCDASGDVGCLIIPTRSFTVM